MTLNALIVGGGIAGMSAAIMLRKVGIDVELIDSAVEWRPIGAGLNINPFTLRAFQHALASTMIPASTSIR